MSAHWITCWWLDGRTIKICQSEDLPLTGKDNAHEFKKHRPGKVHVVEEHDGLIRPPSRELPPKRKDGLFPELSEELNAVALAEDDLRSARRKMNVQRVDAHLQKSWPEDGLEKLVCSVVTWALFREAFESAVFWSSF